MMRRFSQIFSIVLLVVGSDAQILSFGKELSSKYFIEETNSSYSNRLGLIQKNYRLPKTVIPETYNITLTPLLNGSFPLHGLVKIQAKVVKRTKRIVLHHGHLILHEYSVHTDEGEVKINKVSYDTVTEKFTIFLDSYLSSGTKILLSFKYEGKLNYALVGFYKSFYIDSDGNRRWLATTHFQPTFARRAIPCFDEPFFKAKFNLFIRRPKHYTALTNMPKYASYEDSDFILDAFEETPKMSIYLIAIVVSDFAVLNNNKSNVRVWSRRNIINGGHYAMHFGTKVLNVFENLFKQKNPVPKTDMVAIPNFTARAMENWGLITYKEKFLINNGQKPAKQTDDEIAFTVAHECAHQWFGNLVSPKWWDFAWLSEAFASYFQYIGTQMVIPNCHINEKLLETLETSLFFDTSVDFPPLSRAVENPMQINKMFSQTVYIKGCSIVRMMHLTFGPEIFFGAMRDYIKEHKFGIVENNDLWRVFQNRVYKHKPDLNVSVEDIMSNWITMSGFPVLLVNITKHEIILSQKPFSINKNVGIKNKTWFIPITYTTGKSLNFSSTVTNMWINSNTKIKMHNATDTWIVFNNLAAGYYRVSYDNESWYRIIKCLNSKNYKDIHEINRGAIISDLYSLFQFGLVDYKVIIDCLQYIDRETEYFPLRMTILSLTFWIQQFEKREVCDKYAEDIRKILTKVYTAVKLYIRKNARHADLFNNLLHFVINRLNALCEQTVYNNTYEKTRTFDDLRNYL